jgi:DNA polymerase-3 subunit beta
VQVQQPGQVVIPADKFSAIVRESADEVLSMQTVDSNFHIRGADSHFSVYTQPPAQFPQLPEFDGEPHIEAALQLLQEAISMTLFAVARESSRYAINGVLWEITGKKLSLVATDGRRLAKCRLALTTAQAKELPADRFIVPGKAMALLQKLPAGEKETLALRVTGNRIVARCGGVVISSNLVEGSFPKYDDIIPTDCDKKLTLATDAVLSAVRRAALLTSEESKGIKLRLSENSLQFSAKALETGDAQIDMSVQYSGAAIEIGFNPQFLLEPLRVLKQEQFELELGQPDRPGIIKGGPNFLYLIMPINLG